MFEIAFWVVRFIFGKPGRENETTDEVKGKPRVSGKKRRFGLQRKSFGRHNKNIFQAEVGIA